MIEIKVIVTQNIICECGYEDPKFRNANNVYGLEFIIVPKTTMNGSHLCKGCKERRQIESIYGYRENAGITTAEYYPLEYFKVIR